MTYVPEELFINHLERDKIAENYYDKLAIKADSCIKCGHCESRCPFNVKQEDRMEEINKYFKSLK